MGRMASVKGRVVGGGELEVVGGCVVVEGVCLRCVIGEICFCIGCEVCSADFVASTGGFASNSRHRAANSSSGGGGAFACGCEAGGSGGVDCVGDVGGVVDAAWDFDALATGVDSSFQNHPMIAR